jgi:peptidoglycan/LPS O-acetylase OafA/YrhL
VAHKTPANSAISRIQALDGLRGTAILIVVFHHLYRFEGIKSYLDSTFLKPFWGIAEFGWTGVDLFFVLSGFLITSILLNTKESPRYFKSFYGRRAVRIFPLYFLCLLIFYYVPFSIFHYPGGHIPEGHQIWFFTYLANWKIAFWTPDELSIFWSLCVEEQFYLIWPLVIWVTGKRAFPWLCLAVIFASLSAGVGFEFAGMPRFFVLFASVPRLQALVFGALLSWLVRQSWLSKVTEHLKLVIPTSFGLMLVFALDPPYFRGLYTLEMFTAAVGFSALLLVCCTQSDGLGARIMRCRLLCSFGKFSYAIYVLHAWIMFYVAHLVARLATPYISSRALLLTAITVAVFSSDYLVGILSWHLFEKHFMRLKSFFPYELSSPAQEPAVLAEAAVVEA